MDVYPRSRIWPLLTVVLLLFGAAIYYPAWRISWETLEHTKRWAIARWQGDAGFPGAAESNASKQVHGAGPLPRAWNRRLRVALAPLQPPVAQRVAVEVEPDFRAYAETVSTAGFPPDLATQTMPLESDQPIPRAVDASSAVGPELPAGAHDLHSAVRSLELPRSDLDTIATSLPDTSVDLSFAETRTEQAEPAGPWPRTTKLYELWGQLPTDNGQIAKWKAELAEELTAFHSLDRLTDESVPDRLRRLSALASKTEMLEAYLAPPDRVKIRCLRFGMERRIAVWGSAHELAMEQEAAPLLVNVIDAIPVLEEVERRVATNPYADTWREWLMLEKLTQIATETWVTDPTVRWAAAQTVLSRLQRAALTDAQRVYLQDPAIRDLERQLTDWSDQPIDLRNLLQTLEQYEHVRSANLADMIVQQLARLEYCRRPAAPRVARAIDTYYRNANVRISVAGRLLNDLLPVLEPMRQSIRENILGANVVGQNRTWTDLEVRLIEDPERLRLRIQANGRSRSQTVSTKGAFHFYSRDHARFQAGKDLLVSPQGIYVTRATGSARGDSKLLRLKTDYDQIPLLGWIVRKIALDEHREKSSLVRSTMSRRITHRATSPA